MRYKFRTKYSESDEYTIYRHYHYTPRQLGIRGFLATVCAAIGICILLPSPDELVVIPPLVAVIRHLVTVDLAMATVYAYSIYTMVGLILLAAAFILGAEYVRDALFSEAKNMRKNGKKLHNKIKQTGQRVGSNLRSQNRDNKSIKINVLRELNAA